MPTPNLVLVGHGITDSLQLTVEAQRVLSRYGSAYALELPPNLAAYLKAQRVKITSLAAGFAPGKAYAEAYLEVASRLLERTAHERPVVFLCPGHPMLFNSIGRYLSMEGQRLGLAVQVIPAVSQLELIVGGIGLDVSTFGLQVFDATRLVRRRVAINPAIPTVLMNLSGFNIEDLPAAETQPDLGPLVAYLSGCYPPAHVATVVNLSPAGTSVASVPLGSLTKVAGQLGQGSHLFLDLVRPATSGTAAP